MKIQFDDPLFEAWTQRPILTIAEGGAEIGEIKATAAPRQSRPHPGQGRVLIGDGVLMRNGKSM